MKLTKKSLLKQVKSIKKSIKKNPLYLVLGSLTDLAFFIAFSFATMHMFSKIKESTEAVYRLLSEQTTLMQESPTAEMMSKALESHNLFMAHYDTIIHQVYIYIGIIFCAWIIFQLLAWILAHKLITKKFKIKEYIPHFLGISASVGALCLLVVHLSIKFSATLTQSIIPIMTPQTVNVIVTVIFAIIVYLMMMGYALAIKKAWYKGILRKSIAYPLETGGVFLILTVLLVTINYLMMRLVAVHWIIFLMFAIGIVLPSYTLARVFWIQNISKLK